MIRVLFSGKELRERRRETILHPPEGVEFRTMVPIEKLKPDFVISKTPSKTKLSFPEVIRKLIYTLEIPNIRYIPKRYLSDIDLIYTPGQLLLNKKPYVIEIDNAVCLAFFRLKILKKRMNLIKKFLEAENCKRLICIGEAARKSVINTFGSEKVSRKSTVVYPYVKINKYSEGRKDNKIVILTSNTKFYMKGTRDVLLAFEVLNKKYSNLELWIVSNTPKEYLEKYSQFKNIKFFPATFNKEELYRNFYSQCDIFVQPSYQDSLGMTYLEVAASGKPIITTDIFGNPEVVISGFNGFLISPPFYMHNPDFTLKEEYFPIKVKDTENDFYKKINGQNVVRDLVKYASILIENKKLREEMGQNSLKLAKTRFSDDLRRKKLLEIFQSAITNNNHIK